jgi:L-histidine N-alpha-methyltransferase
MNREESRPVRADGFENSRHRAEFASSLRRRILPLKFAYTGSAAHTHDQLSRSSGYQNVIGPVRAEVQAFLGAALQREDGGTHQVVEIGPGNGVHTAAFFEHLAERGAVPEAYYALDFSETLLGLAYECVAASEHAPKRIDVGLWDVEEMPSPLIKQWRTGGEPVIACFFGNTIGNVEQPALALSNIARSLESGDRLVLSTTLLPDRPDVAELLSPYRTQVFHAAVLEVFRMAGIGPDDVRLELVFEDGAVRGIAECLAPVEFDGVRLERGELVRCFTSRRFATAEVLALLNEAGWVVTEGSDSGEHFVVSATRK